MKLVTIPTTIEANSEVLTKEYVTTLSISPQLPDGANISFNLNHLNLSKSSPNKDSSSTKVNSILIVDDVEYKITSSNESNDRVINTIAGCQSEYIYTTSLSEYWGPIVINNTSTLKLVTYTSVIRNESVNCYVGTSDDTYTITNLKITGCNCCSVIQS